MPDQDVRHTFRELSPLEQRLTVQLTAHDVALQVVLRRLHATEVSSMRLKLLREEAYAELGWICSGDDDLHAAAVMAISDLFDSAIEG